MKRHRCVLCLWVWEGERLCVFVCVCDVRSELRTRKYFPRSGTPPNRALRNAIKKGLQWRVFTTQPSLCCFYSPVINMWRHVFDRGGSERRQCRRGGSLGAKPEGTNDVHPASWVLKATRMVIKSSWRKKKRKNSCDVNSWIVADVQWSDLGEAVLFLCFQQRWSISRLFAYKFY